MENKSLKDIRKEKSITQIKASEYLGISLRSYKTYENDASKVNTLKYEFLCEKLSKYNFIDEEHGILDITYIKQTLKNILDKYDVNFCYLFGSYAKGKANALSDVDLLIDTNLSGLDFYGLVEDLRNNLHKKIDLLKVNQLENNLKLLTNILKDGVKLYG